MNHKKYLCEQIFNNRSFVFPPFFPIFKSLQIFFMDLTFENVSKLILDNFDIHLEKSDENCVCLLIDPKEGGDSDIVYLELAKRTYNSKPIGMNKYLIIDGSFMSTHDIINKYIPLTEDNISNVKNFIHKFYTEFVENSN